MAAQVEITTIIITLQQASWTSKNIILKLVPVKDGTSILRADFSYRIKSTNIVNKIM